MAREETSWMAVAETLGYATEMEMLLDLYVHQGLSLSHIARIVGYTPWSVRRRLLFQGVHLRSRGGPNNKGKRYLANLSDEELNGPVGPLALKYGCHVATIFAERRTRKCNSAISATSAPSAATEIAAEPTSL